MVDFSLSLSLYIYMCTHRCVHICVHIPKRLGLTNSAAKVRTRMERKAALASYAGTGCYRRAMDDWAVFYLDPNSM